MKIQKIKTLLESFPLIKGVRGIFALAILFFSFSFANAELNVLWFTKSLNVQVGETFKVDIYLEPEADHPVVTVSNTLNYNPNKLKFISAEFPNSWTVLSETPNNITDEENGYLRRTGGVANGVNKNVKYITYEFKALEEGNTQFYIEDGFALDIENTDIGFEDKKMRINILPKTNISTTTSILVTPTTTAQISLPPALDISSKNAIRFGEDYVLKILSDPGNVTDNLSEVKLSLLNSLRQEIYTDKNSFNYSNQKSLSFTIPKDYLEEGDYTINLKTNYTNGTVENQKEFGVLESDQTWLDKNKVAFFSTLAFIILVAWLYHIHRDHIMFRNLRRKAREYHEVHVGHKK